MRNAVKNVVVSCDTLTTKQTGAGKEDKIQRICCRLAANEGHQGLVMRCEVGSVVSRAEATGRQAGKNVLKRQSPEGHLCT